MPPSDRDLVERVCTLIARALDLPPSALPLGPETRLHGAGLGVDSLDTLRLVAALEEEFDIIIDDAELTPSTFEDVASVVRLVRKLR